MNTNIYVNGIEIPDGIPTVPSFSFLTDPATGLFLNRTNTNVKSLGIAMKGRPIALFGTSQVELMQSLKFAPGSADQSFLTSDPNGVATWKVANASGSFKWNSLFAGLDFTQSNYSINITFLQQFANTPSVVLSKETLAPIADGFDLYAKNKSVTGYTAFSNFTMFKTLVSDTVGDYTTVRLSTGAIAIAYFSATSNRVTYVSTTDSFYTGVNTPVVVDTLVATGLVSMCMVGTFPAIAYVVFNTLSNKYEFRYTIANDVNGLTFKNPVVVYSTAVNITGLPISLILLMVSGNPAVFLNTETGASQIFRAGDSAGSSFGSAVQISNLTNHQIFDVQIINGLPAILARANTTGSLYYVQSSSATGSVWPIGATQILKTAGANFVSNVNKYSTTMGLINGVLTIIGSELGSNSLFTAAANDINGASFNALAPLIINNTAMPFTTIFQNNGVSYVIYNNTTGLVSKKDIIQFASDGTIALATDAFITTLANCGDNQAIINQRDNNNIIVVNGNTKLILIRFFGNDFNVNWVAVN